MFYYTFYQAQEQKYKRDKVLKIYRTKSWEEQFLMIEQIIQHIILFLFFQSVKDKMRNYFGELSPESNSDTNLDYSLVFKKQHRKTLGSQQDLEDKSSWNISTTKLPHFYSPPKDKYDFIDYKKVMEENQRLKDEVRGLKELLVNSGAISKNYEKIDGSLRLKKDEKVQQIAKLKKIIQKSYYSIKQMEDQISKLNQQLSISKKSLATLEKKYKILEFQKEELESKINNINLVHKQEIQICNDRIWNLEMKIKDLIELIEQDQINWSLHTQQLNTLKKFYSSRTLK